MSHPGRWQAWRAQAGVQEPHLTVYAPARQGARFGAPPRASAAWPADAASARDVPQVGLGTGSRTTVARTVTPFRPGRASTKEARRHATAGTAAGKGGSGAGDRPVEPRGAAFSLLVERAAHTGEREVECECPARVRRVSRSKPYNSVAQSIGSALQSVKPNLLRQSARSRQFLHVDIIPIMRNLSDATAAGYFHLSVFIETSVTLHSHNNPPNTESHDNDLDAIGVTLRFALRRNGQPLGHQPHRRPDLRAAVRLPQAAQRR